jgi:predicted ArsR family transcriptional regulator
MRTPFRQAKAIELLRQGPKTVREIASKLGISRYHSRAVLGALRAKEVVMVRGTVPGQGMDQKVWALAPRMRKADQWVPLQHKEQRSAEQARWLAELLEKWERFMRSYWGPHGYPQHSPGMPSRARIQSFDDLEEEVDRHCVAACDAAIDDLPERLRSAIFYRHRLTDVWAYSGHPEDLVELAHEALLPLLRKRLAVP